MSTVTIENFVDMSLEKRKLVLSWRNSDRVRLRMTNQDIIPLDQHLRFIDGLVGRDDKMYFLFSIDDEPFGVLDLVDCNWNEKSCETGLYIGNEKFLGLGMLLYYYNCQVAFDHFHFETISSSILKNNIGALSISTRLFGWKIVDQNCTEYFVCCNRRDWVSMPQSFKQKILSNAQIGETKWKV